MEPGLYETAVVRRPVRTWPNGCHICEVEIDPDTGAVEIVRYTVVDDVGTVINPLLVKGQILGGVAQGVGQALMEDRSFRRDRPAAHRLVHGLRDAARGRLSRDVEVETHPVPTKLNPLGVKGAGEAGTGGRAAGGCFFPTGTEHFAWPVALVAR